MFFSHIHPRHLHGSVPSYSLDALHCWDETKQLHPLHHQLCDGGTEMHKRNNTTRSQFWKKIECSTCIRSQLTQVTGFRQNGSDFTGLIQAKCMNDLIPDLDRTDHRIPVEPGGSILIITLPLPEICYFLKKNPNHLRINKYGATLLKSMPCGRKPY